MKKLFILNYILFVFSLTSFSQGLSLTYNSKTVKPDSVYIIYCNASESIVDSVIVKNISEDGIYVMVKKIIKDTLTGTLNFFCWKKCYNSSVYTSPDSIIIYPGSSNNSFYGEYHPRDKIGSSTITYVFFDKNNKKDTSSITFKYISTPDAIQKYSKNNSGTIDIYPNPANNAINISYNIFDNISNSHLIIYNQGGQMISDITINDSKGKALINTLNLPNGIYSASLINRNKVYSVSKFSVIH